jgi:hypothetical protein
MKRIYKKVPTAFRVKEKSVPYKVAGHPDHVTYHLACLGEAGGALEVGQFFLSSYPVTEDPWWAMDARVVRDVRVQQNCDKRGLMDNDVDRFLKAHPGANVQSDGAAAVDVAYDGDLIIETSHYPYKAVTPDGKTYRFDEDGKFLGAECP